MTGYTGSTQTTFPAVLGPDLTFNGTTDAFVAKVNAAGTGLNYCGYIGGTSSEFGYGIAANDSGNAYVTGQTNSTESSFPVTFGPDLTFNYGSNYAFIAKVNARGTGLLYCGYIGGSLSDAGFSIAADGWGNAYVTGNAASGQGSFPVLVGPDLTHNGGTDAFIARIYSYAIPAHKHAVGDFNGDGSDELAVDFGSAGVWLWDGGSWSQISAVDPENLLAGDTDGDNAQEIIGDFGSLGLWLWDAGSWSQISANDPD